MSSSENKERAKDLVFIIGADRSDLTCNFVIKELNEAEMRGRKFQQEIDAKHVEKVISKRVAGQIRAMEIS